MPVAQEPTVRSVHTGGKCQKSVVQSWFPPKNIDTSTCHALRKSHVVYEIKKNVTRTSVYFYVQYTHVHFSSNFRPFIEEAADTKFCPQFISPSPYLKEAGQKATD